MSVAGSCASSHSFSGTSVGIKGPNFACCAENAIPTELGGDPSSPVTVNGVECGRLDVNGDGNYTDLSAPSSGMYNVGMAPVEVRISWQIPSGPVQVRRFAMVARRS
ncbi:MAG TPA: hypothetical protein PLI95_03155, partial [Polyangiaceae bacterium]|nr:hypothetical protein [Polyangiaceae bacterium]